METAKFEIADFKDLYIAELQELVSGERQLSELLVRALQMATDPSLKGAITQHRDETQAQSDRLAAILRKHGADIEAHTDQAMEALIRETDKMLGLLRGNELRDAGLVASLQKLEHYEIAAYGTAAALAGQLHLRDDQQALRQSMEEERQADLVLTKLAKDQVNRKALAA